MLFLCRLLGAGDVKIMALCVGYLGAEDGIMVLFLGFLLAAVPCARKLIREGQLYSRLSKIAEFALCICLKRKIFCYRDFCDPEGNGEPGRIRLIPFLFGGYCLYFALAVLGWSKMGGGIG